MAGPDEITPTKKQLVGQPIFRSRVPSQSPLASAVANDRSTAIPVTMRLRRIVQPRSRNLDLPTIGIDMLTVTRA